MLCHVASRCVWVSSYLKENADDILVESQMLMSRCRLRVLRLEQLYFLCYK